VYAVVHVIPTFGVDHVYAMVVAPADWPRLHKNEILTATCEATTVLNPAIHVGTMLAGEVGAVMCL
jgi:hypothetical protein